MNLWARLSRLINRRKNQAFRKAFTEAKRQQPPQSQPPVRQDPAASQPTKQDPAASRPVRRDPAGRQLVTLVCPFCKTAHTTTAEDRQSARCGRCGLLYSAIPDEAQMRLAQARAVVFDRTLEALAEAYAAGDDIRREEAIQRFRKAFRDEAARGNPDSALAIYLKARTENETSPVPLEATFLTADTSGSDDELSRDIHFFFICRDGITSTGKMGGGSAACRYIAEGRKVIYQSSHYFPPEAPRKTEEVLPVPDCVTNQTALLRYIARHQISWVTNNDDPRAHEAADVVMTEHMQLILKEWAERSAAGDPATSAGSP